MAETIGRTKIRELAADRLKRYILERNLKAGDRLPTETQLAARFGISRLSLREATKSLEFLGIVEARPGRGLTVGAVNMERVTEYLGFHPALQDISADELIETRLLVETGVLPYVARRMQRDPAPYAKLNALNTSLRQARTLARWVELDLEFHRELVRASGLAALTAFTDMLSVFFQRFRESVKKAEWSRGIESHQRLIDALRQGQVREADRELRQHITSHRDRGEAP